MLYDLRHKSHQSVITKQPIFLHGDRYVTNPPLFMFVSVSHTPTLTHYLASMIRSGACFLVCCELISANYPGLVFTVERSRLLIAMFCVCITYMNGIFFFTDRNITHHQGWGNKFVMPSLLNGGRGHAPKPHLWAAGPNNHTQQSLSLV